MKSFPLIIVAALAFTKVVSSAPSIQVLFGSLDLQSSFGPAKQIQKLIRNFDCFSNVIRNVTDDGGRGDLMNEINEIQKELANDLSHCFLLNSLCQLEVLRNIPNHIAELMARSAKINRDLANKIHVGFIAECQSYQRKPHLLGRNCKITVNGVEGPIDCAYAIEDNTERNTEIFDIEDAPTDITDDRDNE